MKRIKIEDGTHWPDPTDYGDTAWRMIHHPENVTREDMLKAAAVMEAYKTLITHPGFTLKDVQRKV